MWKTLECLYNTAKVTRNNNVKTRLKNKTDKIRAANKKEISFMNVK
jgi:hypothetical protein